MDRKIGRIIEATFLVLLVVFAFWTTFQAGERGLFGYDQSIVFDGGYRVLLGQVPYRDFIIPIGPVVFWIQALFFAFFGVEFHTCILAAAFFNVLAALLTVGIIKLLFPGRKVIPCAAGFLTAVWFYPPFGTLYLDQTAFFFSLLALYVLLLSMLKAEERPFLRPLLLLLAGGLAVASFLSKQNAGLFFLPLFPLLILAHGGKRLGAQCAVFFGALLAAFAAFLAWVHVCSDLSEFLVRFFKVPAEMGVGRVFRAGGVLRVLGFIYTGDGPVVTRIVVAFSCLLSAFVLLLYFSNRETLAGMWRRLLLAAFVCLYCSFYQYFFLFSTKNQPENCLPFLGAIFGIGACLAFDLLSNMTIRIHVPGRMLPSPSRQALRRGAFILLAILFLYSLERGRALSLQRSVHEVFAVPVFNERLSVRGLHGLKWGKHTKVRPEWNFLDMEKGEIDRKKYIASPGIEAADLVSLVEYLKKQGAPFFVFPDHTILYGLLGATPPQPLLWFHRGLTYPMEYDPELDGRIVLALRKNDVETVILEEDSFWGAGKRLNDFPLLKAYIDDRFTRATRFGIFILYEKNKPEEEPRAATERR